jgi:hypothetical protein
MGEQCSVLLPNPVFTASLATRCVGQSEERGGDEKRSAARLGMEKTSPTIVA